MVPLMGRREYLRWIWVPPPPIDEWATRDTLTERMEYHRNVFARHEAEEKERRLSKVVRESTDAEEVARARADLYERVTLRSEARGGGFTLADFMSGAFSCFLPPGYSLPLNRPPKRHAAAVAGDEDDDEDTASSITTCRGERKEKRQRIVVPPRVQDGKEEDAASESVASHQVGEDEEEEEEETGGEALASSSSP